MKNGYFTRTPSLIGLCRNAGALCLLALIGVGLVSCKSMVAGGPEAMPGRILADSPALTSRAPNMPIGTAMGVKPGRVVWVHDPDAVNWDGETGLWYDSSNFDQRAVDRMMSQAICALAGKKSAAAAWKALFRHFNQTHGRGSVGYKRGEKIMIKLNLSGLHMLSVPESQRWEQAVNTTPAMTMSLLKQLIEVAGVAPPDITVGDTGSYFSPMYFDQIHAAWPQVNCLAFKSYDGRVGATPSDHPVFWSTPAAAGKAQDYAPKQYAEATYLINFAQLKAHNAGGVTLCGKNHYGSLIRMPEDETPDGKPYFNLHSTLVSRPYGPPGYGQYRVQVDFMGHADFGGKTLLYLLDGLFGYWDAAWEPKQGYKTNKWHSPPFNDNWPCSLLASQDPVAIDSVGYDIWWEEAPYQPGHYARLPGADDYLHEAALADNPPSGTFYDPNHAAPTTRMQSQGVHEHCNNPVERTYSRNLGSGNGIELVTIGVDQTDRREANPAR